MYKGKKRWCLLIVWLVLFGCSGSKPINGKWEFDLPASDNSTATAYIEFKDDGTYFDEIEFHGMNSGVSTRTIREGTWSQEGDVVYLTPTSSSMTRTEDGVTTEHSVKVRDPYSYTLKWQGDDEVDLYFDEATRQKAVTDKEHARRVVN